VPLLTAADIPTHRTNCSCKRAHKWLADLRADAAHRGMEAIDLSNHADWRLYICSHPKAREIIGEGVVKFEGRFLNSLEPNHRQLLLPEPYGRNRFDFLALRASGEACRMHPGSNRDAEITQGRYEAWLIPPSASTPGAASGAASAASSATPDIMQRTGLAFLHYSQVDIISAESALRTLMDIYHEHRRNGGNDEDLDVDLLTSVLTPGGFEWHRFLMGRPFGVKLVKEEVVEMRLVWHAGGLALRVATVVSQPRHITFRGNKAMLCP